MIYPAVMLMSAVAYTWLLTVAQGLIDPVVMAYERSYLAAYYVLGWKWRRSWW